MSKLRYKGPAKPVPTKHDPFDDVWLAWSFAFLFCALMCIFYLWG